jgi:hypothetical protein
MTMASLLRFAFVSASLAAIALPAQAEDRTVLVNCKALVERAAKDTSTANEAEVAHCRQIIREWALRDARMIVDEQGRPLR